MPALVFISLVVFVCVVKRGVDGKRNKLPPVSTHGKRDGTQERSRMPSSKGRPHTGDKTTQGKEARDKDAKDKEGKEDASEEGISLSPKRLEDFTAYLREREMAEKTIEKYLHDVEELSIYTGEWIRGKGDLISFKDILVERKLEKKSINAKLAAINCLLSYMGRPEWKLRYLRIQRETFQEDGKELTLEEYRRLVLMAEQKGRHRLALLLETLCGLGIRVSELSAVTVESLAQEKAEIELKGKIRTILLNTRLTEKLREYCREQGITAGPVFVTRTGRTLDRAYIWREMKKLAEDAGVSKEKVYPHNLRHLFALTYYSQNKDIVRLADLMGHSSINTTRIYTTWKGNEQKEQLERMELVC